MRKLLFWPIFCLALVLSSCSSDDDDPGIQQPDQSPVGTWILTELNINPPQDIDGDGTPTTNILTELPCATGTIIIDEDGTWTSTTANLSITTITGGLFIIDCDGTTTEDFGNWALQNSQLTLFRNPNLVFFSLNDNRIINNSNEDLPGFTSEVYVRQ